MSLIYIYLYIATLIIYLIIYGCQNGKITTLRTGTLERNPHITLAHVNPEAFPPLDSEPGKHCSMWFIGLSFAKSESLNIDLTYDIKSFVETSRFDFVNYIKKWKIYNI